MKDYRKAKKTIEVSVGDSVRIKSEPTGFSYRHSSVNHIRY